MVSVKILPEAIFSYVHINKPIKKLDDTTRFYYYLSLSCTFMSIVLDLYIGSSENGSSHVCDKAEIFYVSIIIMLR